MYRLFVAMHDEKMHSDCERRSAFRCFGARPACSTRAPAVSGDGGGGSRARAQRRLVCERVGGCGGRVGRALAQVPAATSVAATFRA